MSKTIVALELGTSRQGSILSYPISAPSTFSPEWVYSWGETVYVGGAYVTGDKNVSTFEFLVGTPGAVFSPDQQPLFIDATDTKVSQEPISVAVYLNQAKMCG